MDIESPPPPHKYSGHGYPGTDNTLVTELLGELRASRDAAAVQQAELARERQSERRWRTITRMVFFGLPLLCGLAYTIFVFSYLGRGTGSPRDDSVGIVRIDGEIGAEQTASAKNVIAALKKAFESPKTKAVVLSIDSPGGAPVEAERINDALAALKKKHEKPVVAVIGNMGASAAYMVAMQADKIYAGKYSLVGSIGAIVSGWDLHRAMARLDVSQRTYASGPLKSMLNPFEPMSPAADAKAQGLVAQMGKAFAADLAAQRGKSLKPETDYATGEVWGGEEAKAIGLIDEIGTLDQVVATSWGVGMHDFGPRKSNDFGLLGQMMNGMAQSLAHALVSEARLEVR
ncbi:MAG: S49 family peptidase [Rhizobacter sp.]